MITNKNINELVVQYTNSRSLACVLFELTYGCTYRCPHCYLKGKYEEGTLSTEDVKKILDGLSELGVLKVIFTGGDPFTRDDFIDVLAYSKKKGFVVTVFTNGVSLTDENIKMLSEVCVDSVEVTVNSLKPSIYHELTGSVQDPKDIIESMKKLKQEGIQVTLKSTAMRPNAREMAEISRLCEKNGFLFKMETNLLHTSEGTCPWPASFQLSADEAKKLRREIYPQMFEGQDRLPYVHWGSSPHNCIAGLSTASINPFGRMNICNFSKRPDADVLAVGVKAAWRMVKDEVDHIKSLKHVCVDCELRQYCACCPVRALNEAGSYSVCVKSYKIQAQQRRESENGTN